FENGKFIGKTRDIREVRVYCAAQIDTLWDEVTRFENPHNFYVDLSQKLWDEKTRLLESHKTR
ncbi:MAG: nicotinate phosphoribosyltransferase, partial [Eubacterium sp.]|nr:nicotinate phosphoribosyltransferase [Eubacterium sp.]